MFKAKQYREKAAEYRELIKNTVDPGEVQKFQGLESSFSTLGQNEEWLADNFDKLVHAPRGEEGDSAALAEQEQHILRCLGAAVIMQWKTIPTKLQRELFDTAGSVGDLLQTSALRGQIARFLHNHSRDDKSSSC
jgi:hypothetical protein